MADGLLSDSRRHDDVTAPEGFPVEIVDDKLNSKYQCAVCRLILKNPFQGTCGHRFCKNCVDHLLQCNISSPNGATSTVCVACQEEDTVDDSSIIHGDQMYRDVALRKEMSVLGVHCCNTDCQWKGQFKDYEIHSSECDHVLIQCEFCKERIPRNCMERHTSREHLLMTAKPGQLCPFSCGMTIDENGIRRHIETNLAVHLDALNERLKFVEHLVLPEQRSMENACGSTLLERVSRLEQRTAELKSRSESSTSTREPERQAAETSSISSGQPEVDFRGLSELLDVLIRGAKVVKREQERVSRRLLSFVAQCAEDRKREEALRSAIEAKEMSASLPVLGELESRIERLETMTTDGVLIWKITDFDKRRSDAVTGIATSFYSPPFLTHPTGYKMCARIYLNGDGTGKRSHVSLFFVVMRGNYDALLSWPFGLPVTLAILDQDDGMRSHVESFQTDAESTSFRRPSTEMNPASGFPNFMSFRLLEMRRASFVKDDVMFVKVTVDARGLTEIKPRTSAVNR